MISKAVANGLTILNVTQCKAGSVNMNKYENGLILKNAGVASGFDITFEAAVAKLMYLLGKGFVGSALALEFANPIAGEITLYG
jgi:L-asparaginase